MDTNTEISHFAPTEIDWEMLGEAVERLRHEIPPFELPSPAVVDRYRISLLTYGLVPNDFEQGINWGRYLYWTDNNWMEIARRVAVEFGFGPQEDIPAEPGKG